MTMKMNENKKTEMGLRAAQYIHQNGLGDTFSVIIRNCYVSRNKTSFFKLYFSDVAFIRTI